MADIHIPERAKTAVERVKVAAGKVSDTLQSRYADSGIVLALAVALAVLHIELQYVAGAFVVFYAQRLSNKKLSNPSYSVVSEPPPTRKHADMFPAPPDELTRAMAELSQ